MHSWMSDNHIVDQIVDLTFRFDILRALEVLPVKNKTTLHDSKVLSTVQRWTKISEYTNEPKVAEAKPSSSEDLSPCDSGSVTPIDNETASSPKQEEAVASSAAAMPTSNATASVAAPAAPTSTTVSAANALKSTDVMEAIPQILEQSSALKGLGVDMLKRIIDTNEKNVKIIEDSVSNEKLPDGEVGQLIRDIRLLAMKLVTSWEQLPESFKIPKKLRIEQMKEHEREADQSYKETVQDEAQKPAAATANGIRPIERRERDGNGDGAREKDPRFRRYATSTISKQKRRQMFEAKVSENAAIIRKVRGK